MSSRFNGALLLLEAVCRKEGQGGAGRQGAGDWWVAPPYLLPGLLRQTTEGAQKRRLCLPPTCSGPPFQKHGAQER